MNLLNFFLETLAAAVTSFVSIAGTVRMAGQKYRGKKQALFLLAAVLAETGVEVLADYRSLYRISDFTLWIVLINLAFAFSAALALSKGTIFRKISATAVSTLAVSALNCLVFCVSGAVMGVGLFTYNPFAILMHAGSSRRCYLLALIVSALALYGALWRVMEKARDMDNRQWGMLLGGAAVVFGAGWGLVKLAFWRDWLVPGYTFGFFGTLVLSVLIWAFARYRKEKRTNEILYTSNELMTENYRRLYENQVQRAKELHDFNHHISALRGLALEGKAAEAAAYADRLLQASYREKRLCHSGNDVVDAVINRKAAEAEAARTAFSYSVTFSVPNAIDPVDVCAILANQLDNALDACGEIEDAEQRSVEVRIWRQTGNIVFFQVSNTAEKNPFTPDGRLISQKRDRSRPHGLGLKSIRDAAQKYQGDLKNTWRDGKFTSTVFLCFDEE